MNATETPVLIRAKITANEWTRLRQHALEVKRPVAELVAEALRKTYDLKETAA